MVRGIEIAASGMAGVMTLNDILANNMANVNTTGFKQAIPVFKSFSDVLVNQITPTGNTTTENKEVGVVNKISAGSVLDATVLDFSQGGINHTGNPLDLAINGKGFFEVETDQGTFYTRNGSFVLAEDGSITTTEGYKLVGDNGPISISVGSTQLKDINVDSKGNIQVNGQIIDKVKIVDFQDKASIQAMGNSLFKSVVDETPSDAEGFEISQGALESSNGNIVETMVSSINAMRTYDSLAKLIDSSNKTLQKNINEVGRIKR